MKNRNVDLKKLAMDMYAYSEEELKADGGIAKEMKVDDLLGMGTMCGDPSKACFDKDAIAFLKKNKVKKVGVVLMPDEDDPSKMLVSDMSASMTFEDAEAFGELISEKGGSLRPDGEDGEVGFESE